MPAKNGDSLPSEVQVPLAPAAPVESQNKLEYDLKGMQAEPTAGLWLDNKPPIQVPTFSEVENIAEGVLSKETERLVLNFADDYPFDPNELYQNKVRKLNEQLEILIALQKNRGNSPYPTMVETEKGKIQFLTPISRFINLQPIPFGTIFDTFERPQLPVSNVLEQHMRIVTGSKLVNEGRELARKFENETPGLFHRHALNWILFNRADISPPRQARIWMALDIAIYAALNAAWRYKWLKKPYSRLLRPDEYDRKDGVKTDLKVLFDSIVKPNGQEGGMNRTCPDTHSGTPRHPAWPSGHSTYSAAASHVLEYFFSPDTLTTPDSKLFKDFPASSEDISNPRWIAAELRRLANNIGEARLWAGVHWISDHKAGQKIGRSAAEAVIAQLRKDCIPKFMPPDPDPEKCDSKTNPPTNKKIMEDAKKCPPDHDEINQPKNRGEIFRRDLGVF